MAKEIGRFIMEISGTKADGPVRCVIRYNLQDSSDSTLRTGMKDKEVSSPNFNKTFHNAETAGEFWKDEMAAIETEEGVS